MLTELKNHLYDNTDGLDEATWTIRRSGVDNYSRTFREVLSLAGYSNLRWLIARLEKRRGASPIALDLMSYGAFLRDAGLKGASVGLTADMSMSEKALDQLEGRGFIEGNVLERKTWSAIATYQQTHVPGGFDLAICRPVGAVDVLDNNVIKMVLLQRLMRIVNPQSGIILSEFRTGITQRNDLVEKTKGKAGIFLAMSENAFERSLDCDILIDVPVFIAGEAAIERGMGRMIYS